MPEAVTNWATDFEIFDPEYVEDPTPVWDELRQRCPIAHTERRAPSWLPTTYEDVVAMARDIEHFSSVGISVIPPVIDPDVQPGPAAGLFAYGIPPISADPPLHTWTRRLLLPWFSHTRVQGYEDKTRSLCRELLSLVEEGRIDAAADYAQQIPVRVIAWTLGVPEDLSDTFTDWVRDLLEFGDDPPRRRAAFEGLGAYLLTTIAERKENPGDDLISSLLHTPMPEDIPTSTMFNVIGEVAGGDEATGMVPDSLVLGIAALTLIAGIDTTWSAIGSAIWHLATHPEDQRWLRENPDQLPVAVEEFLRAYSPVTMGRVVTSDVEFGGCPMKAGDRVLMNFPAANRDPAAFENADEVQLDRLNNRHIAFGVGIHRCAGSNLARMEMAVALEEWMATVGEFEIDPDREVTWAGGQVRGPRTLPIRFKETGR